MINELIWKITKDYPKDPKVGMERCFKLQELAKWEDNQHALLTGMAYEAGYRMIQGDFTNCIVAGNYIIHRAKQCGEHRIYAFIENVIGVAYYYECDEQSALEHYYAGLQSALDYGNFDIAKKLYQNIGYLYLHLHDYEKAEEYNRKSLDIPMEEDLAKSKRSNMEIAEPSLVEALFAQGKYDQARRCLSAVKNTMTKEAYRSARLEGCVLVEAKFLFLGNEKKKLKHLLCDILTHVDSELPIMNKFDEYNKIILFVFEKESFFEKEDYAEILKAMRGIEPYMRQWQQQMNTPSKTGEYWNIYALYAEKINDKDGQFMALQKYYESDRIYEESLKKEKIKRIQNWVELDEILRDSKEKHKQGTKLMSMAYKDELTGLANRYGLQEFLKENYNKAVEEQVAIGAMMVDIDNFKYYNDTFGHLEGDKHIKEVADLIDAYVKDTGFAARYGGDEFLVIFLQKSNEFLERIAAKILEESHGITVSIGICNLIPCEDTTSDEVIREADKALYKAKRNQKNNFYFSRERIV